MIRLMKNAAIKRLLAHLAALACLAALVGPAALRAAEQPAGMVRLKTDVELDDSVLRLSDLFEPLAPIADASIARAPAPGKRVELSARWLATVARSYGIDWRPDSRFDRAVVTRRSTTIEAPLIKAVLRDALAEEGVGGDITIILDDPALALHLPVDSLASLGLTGLAYNPSSGRFRVQAVAPAEGTPIAKVTVTGRAATMAEIPVPRRRILPGEIIRPRDLDWRSLPVNRLAADSVLDHRAIVGKSPRRALKAGEPVRAAILQEPVLVAKNALVTLRLVTDRMVLTAQGRALEPGSKGETVRIVNTKSRAMVSGVVLASGAVEVPHPAGGAIR